jgi:hypothetical protein
MLIVTATLVESATIPAGRAGPATVVAITAAVRSVVAVAAAAAIVVVVRDADGYITIPLTVPTVRTVYPVAVVVPATATAPGETVIVDAVVRAAIVV